MSGESKKRSCRIRNSLAIFSLSATSVCLIDRLNNTLAYGNAMPDESGKRSCRMCNFSAVGAKAASTGCLIDKLNKRVA